MGKNWLVDVVDDESFLLLMMLLQFASNTRTHLVLMVWGGWQEV